MNVNIPESIPDAATLDAALIEVAKAAAETAARETGEDVKSFPVLGYVDTIGEAVVKVFIKEGYARDLGRGYFEITRPVPRGILVTALRRVGAIK
jgi:hypothetical protein